MKLIHSFTSKRCNKKNLKVHVYYFTLSALYAKINNFEIVLHTDKQGAELLKFAPYDKIIVDLESFNVPNSRIYAWSKFKAVENEDEGVIHIDGDVFLKKENIKNIIFSNNYDILVQNVEKKGIDNWGYLWDESTQAFARCEYPKFMTRDCNYMYNCGIIKFTDKNIFKEYYKYYWYLINQYLKKGIDLNSVPDLIAEQQLLYDFSNYNNLNVKELLTFPELSKCADEIGYQHVLGCFKYTSFDKCKQKIKEFDNVIYNKLENILWNI